MALFKRGGVWWYKFYFAGQPIRESAKSSSKTVAKNAEQQRRRELEAGFHNLKEVQAPVILTGIRFGRRDIHSLNTSSCKPLKGVQQWFPILVGLPSRE